MHGNKRIDNATTNELILEDITKEDAGSYYLVLKGTCKPNAESDEFLVSVTEDPEILSHTESLNVDEYQMIELSVETTGDDLEYQWYLDNDIIIGANSSTYKIASANLEHSGTYKCIVSNDCKETETADIIVKVNESSDVDDENYDIDDQLGLKIFGSVSTNDMLEYSVFCPNDMNLQIYLVDLNGNIVKELYQGVLSKGDNLLSLDTKDINTGAYWLTVKSEENNISKAIRILK